MTTPQVNTINEKDDNLKDKNLGEALVASSELSKLSKEKDSINTKDTKEQKLKILSPNIKAIDGYIVEAVKSLSGDPMFVPRGREISILAINKVIETQKFIYKLRISTLNGYIDKDLARADMTASKVQELASYGADVFDHNAKIVIQHLRNEEDRKPILNVHEGVGFDIYEGKEIFKHSQAIGIESEYIGKLSIEVKGTMEGWKDMVKVEVIGHTPLEVGIVLGLSALIVGYIGIELGLDCLIIHMPGNSTQGKTTNGQLAISTSGYPDIKANGLMSTWNGTQNALTGGGSLKGNKGLPVFYDESSVSSIKDLTSMIYTLAQGKEKSRMNKEGEIKDSNTWLNTVMSSGEASLSSKSNENIGLKVRLTEFSDVIWTRSAKNAENIKAGVLKHYGHAAPVVAKTMLALGKEKVQEIITKWKEECLEELDKDDPFAPRIALKLGLLMATAEISEDALNLGLNIEAIKDFIIENEKGQESRNLYENAFDYFIEQVESNKHKFRREFEKNHVDNQYEIGELWGVIIKFKEPKEKEKIESEITILTTKFDEIMANGNFSDSKIILKKWKEDGILDCEKDRLTRKRKIGASGASSNVYVIKITSSDSEEDKEPDDSIKKRPVARKSKLVTQAEELFEDNKV